MKNLYKLFVVLGFILTVPSFYLSAQVSVNNDNSEPDGSAMLDVKSASKGVLIPRISFEQRNAIVNPAEGLMVFCTDCGINGTISIYSNGAWRTYAPCTSVAPTAGTHVVLPTQITWNWSVSPGASGYKWNSLNNYSTSSDIGLVTSKTETGFACNTIYTRFIWAYSACGTSTPTTLTQSTMSLPSSPVAGIHVPTATQITWNWDTSIGSTGYKWNTVDDYGTATDIGLVITKTETGMSCNTPYTRYLWAYNGCGNSAPSILTQTTEFNTDPPIAGIHVPGLTQIVWKWNAVVGATGYKWSATNDFANAIDLGAGLLIVETGLTCNSNYIRFAWAYGACGNSIPTTLTQATSPNPPTPPTAGTHIPLTTQIIWNWNPVPGATGYKWNTTNTLIGATTLSANTYTETGLTCNTPYTRYAWAYNACGNSTSITLTQTTSICFICGSSISINHLATGGVAPVDKTVTYGTVNNIPGELTKCWINRNLGASQQATSVDDATEPSAGWYWQFNRKQGYQYIDSRIPTNTWITDITENSNWTTANDPCAIELGTGWRLPTITEWTNVNASGNWTNWDGPYSSALKLHAAGGLYGSNGLLSSRGSIGSNWSSNQYDASTGSYLIFHSSLCYLYNYSKAYGFSIRCLMD